ncbi:MULTISPECIES: hypothetical protein [unclassified Arcicella]|uniref:hypothetical protein n=1 Tax=unclassified Arcicella TaxID=2644986 RepID=UPI0028627B07|nr:MULTISPECIES: hypothetical protein [unclassified Arcicella]MDR6562859.1 heme/copper-type cytochrome/quinol oxidase subunit 4 [Arcicella sp. BE51]MDR6812800.1 heme/copper-type cytochrome/quinol oxidase subunit 4 [Arcicella sp. BE140]MDR6824112.1 heme/copper-type cytochrome/quinol oxidase subunit 4 [Arcicella sp. BE139]
MLDKIIKLTPLAGTLLIFCGVLKLIFFYSHFNIRIVDYLEFQEIVTSFLGDINIIIVFGITMILITVITLNLLGKKAKLPVDELIEQVLVFLYPKRFKYFFGFLVAILITMCLVSLDVMEYNYFVVYLLIFFSIQMLTYLFLYKEESGDVNISNFYGLLLLGITLSISLYLLAQHDIQKIENNLSKTTIILDRGAIHFNAQTKNLYIGKTSKFVFVRMDSLQSTIVIPVEEVKRYEFE